MSHRPHVLIVVQNLPVPLDRRVWLECRALKAAGYDVSVICPKGPGDPAREVIEGVRVFKYRPAPQASGVLGYLVEFGYCWLRTAFLSVRAWRAQPFDVLQACNPPDTYWLLARWWKRKGVRFVFDQHDLNPELFLSRFGQPTSRFAKAQLGFLTWLEKKTYDTADHVISTNRSYQGIAVERGGVALADTTVVRSGPDTTAMRPVHPGAGSGPRRRHTLAYLGIMGPQDGVDTILDVMHELVHVRGRRDVDATLMGFGDCLADLRKQCTAMGLDDVVTFTGRADARMIAEHLSAAAIGLCPDLKTPLNDVSTMNKTMEYMAYALPSVSFDLVETKVSGADTCLYVASGDVKRFCDAIELLLDDPELRLSMARRARSRVSEVLDWKPQSEAYVSVFDRLVPKVQVPASADRTVELVHVDLDREGEFRRFVLSRGPVRGQALGA